MDLTRDFLSDGYFSQLTRKIADIEEILRLLRSGNAIGDSLITAENMLVNGGFDLAQLQTPGTFTTIADKTYGPDQWWITRANADVQYKREDGLSESGITSRYFGTIKKITNAGKFVMVQPIEGAPSVAARSKVVTFQIRMKASSAKTIYLAILELQSAGTIDAPPAALVTAFGANGTNPTFATNVAIISAAQSCSVTTSMQQFYVTVTIPSTSKNLFFAIWPDSSFSVNDTLSFAEAKARPLSIVTPWIASGPDIELLRAQRYIWKTFDPDIAPAQNTGINTGEYLFTAATAGATVQRPPKAPFNTTMFKIPVSATSYNPAAANAQPRDVNAAADCSAIAFGLYRNGLGFVCTGNAATAVGNSLRVHFLVQAPIL